MTIRPRRGGYQVIVYAGIDPVTGRQRQITRQVKGKREAERPEARLRAVEAGELSVSGNVVHGSGLERGYVRKGPRSEHGMRLIALDPHTVQALGGPPGAAPISAGAVERHPGRGCLSSSQWTRPAGPLCAATRWASGSASWPLASATAIRCTGYATATQLGAVASASTVRKSLTGSGPASPW